MVEQIQKLEERINQLEKQQECGANELAIRINRTNSILQKHDVLINNNGKLINQLEQAYQADAQVAKDIIYDGARRNEELRTVQSECDTHCGAITCLERKVEKLESTNNNLPIITELLDRIGKLENKINAEIFTRCSMSILSGKNLDIIKIIKDFEKLEAHVNKLHDMINLDDRLTAKDVLDRLTTLESSGLSHELDPKVWAYVNERLDKLESKTMIMIDIQEHMKQSQWVYQQIERLDNCFSSVGQSCKIPHRCPACDGTGKDKSRLVAQPYDQEIKVLVNPDCHACEGKGVLWN